MKTPLPLVSRYNVAVLAALTVALTLLLWPQWRANPDLSHGFFMPVVFVVLLFESRRGTRRHLPDGAATIVPTVALLGVGLLALCGAGLYAASLDWSHQLVVWLLTLSLTLLLGAGLVVASGGPAPRVALNWSAVIAVLLWLLCTPIPPGSYTRLTLHLQLMVTENVLRTLHLLGIAATREGNVITLATTTVGVEEACSGVRSLISCVFAGLFFSASLVRRPGARAVLIVLAPLLALAMNFVRSLTLTLLANAGIEIGGTWHDLTGFAVLGLTAAILGGLALLLERDPPRPAPAQAAPVAPAVAPNSPRVIRTASLLLAVTLTFAVALGGFFHANTRPSVRRGAPVPNLAAILPLHAAGWQVVTDTQLYQFSDALQTEHLVQRTYVRETPAGLEQITVYLAYWRPGQAAVSLVASHTPDACWPGGGWTAVPAAHPRVELSVSGRPLATAEARFFRSGTFPQHVWFWHLYDGRPIAYRDPYSASALLKIALRYGFRHDGDQLFVRVSSNLPWAQIAAEPVLADIFTRLQPLGL
jgi:exosortase